MSQQYLDAGRNEILDAAKRCFLRDGFHETSMQDLSAEAGLSVGAVDQISAEAGHGARDRRAEHARGDRDDPSFVAAPRGKGLGDALGNVLDVVQRKHAQDQMGAMAVLSWSEALRNPELARRFEALLAPMRADLAEVVREHQANGDLPKTRRPRRSPPC